MCHRAAGKLILQINSITLAGASPPSPSFTFIYIYFVCVYGCVGVCTVYVAPLEARRGLGILGAGGTGDCEHLT